MKEPRSLESTMSLFRRPIRRKWVRALRCAALLTVIVSSAYTIHAVSGGRSPAAVAPVNALAVRTAAESAIAGWPQEISYERLVNPPRTVVRGSSGVVLTMFTDGAHTAVLAGPARSFRTSRAASETVSTSAWVRLLPKPWAAGDELASWFRPWLETALADRSPDALQTALEHLSVEGPRVSGSRFVMFALGLPGRAEAGSPESAPGVPVISANMIEYNRLQPGDLLFFSRTGKDGGPIGYVAMYFGMDGIGRHRVLFSRSAPVLDDDGRLSREFLFARRI